MRVFHLATDLGPTAHGRQLSLLAPEFGRRGVPQTVVALGGVVPFADVPHVRTPLRYAIDLPALRAVRWAAAGHDVVLAWGPLAARVAYLLGLAPRYVLNASAGGWLTRRAARSATGAFAWTAAEAGRYGPNVRIHRIPPATGPAAVVDRHAVRKMLGLPPSARYVLAAGRFDAVADLRSAAVAFDILKYTAADLHLVLAGDGPHRRRLEALAGGLARGDARVRFVGVRDDMPSLIAATDIVWVSHLRGGWNIALEAHAAGVPVVATHNPDLDGIVPPERTVPAGDRVRLAAVTRGVLDSPPTLTPGRHPASASADALLSALAPAQ